MLDDVGLYLGLSVSISFLLTWMLVSFLRALAPRIGLIDIPNQRSSHSLPTPRGGGLAFVLVSPLVATATLVISNLPMPPGMIELLVGGLIVASVGFADDRWTLSARSRFGAYLIAALILVIGGGSLHELQWPGWPSIMPGWIGVPLTLLWVVGLTNVYNFMDGIDGIAAAQGVIAAGTAGVLALWRGSLSSALFPLVLAAAVLGFLFHNWPPARMFMGDVGSAFLGYVLAGLAVLSSNGSGSMPFVIWPILLAPFLFDASLTLVRRIAKGERWYEAHREHLYQRLVRQGWSHLAVMSLYLFADILLAGIAIAVLTLKLEGVNLAIATSLPLVGIAALVSWVEKRPATN